MSLSPLALLLDLPPCKTTAFSRRFHHWSPWLFTFLFQHEVDLSFGRRCLVPYFVPYTLDLKVFYFLSQHQGISFLSFFSSSGVQEVARYGKPQGTGCFRFGFVFQPNDSFHSFSSLQEGCLSRGVNVWWWRMDLCSDLHQTAINDTIA